MGLGSCLPRLARAEGICGADYHTGRPVKCCYDDCRRYPSSDRAQLASVRGALRRDDAWAGHERAAGSAARLKIQNSPDADHDGVPHGLWDTVLHHVAAARVDDVLNVRDDRPSFADLRQVVGRDQCLSTANRTRVIADDLEISVECPRLIRYLGIGNG